MGFLDSIIGGSSFTCRNCGREVSNSEMAGLVIGKISNAVLKQKLGIDIASESLVKKELSAGIVNSFNIPCPKCKESNWK